jgi:hypothetical protein
MDSKLLIVAVDALCLSPCVDSLQACHVLQLLAAMAAMEFDPRKVVAISYYGRLVNLDYASANVPSHRGAFIVKGAKAIVKCNVILYHVYFKRQVCVFYLFKLLFFFAITIFC